MNNTSELRNASIAFEQHFSKIMRVDPSQSSLSLKLYSSKIPAGFPSPADDYIDRSIDLNTHLINHPSATFIMRVKGECMNQAGIFPDSLIIVDRSVKAEHNKIVVAALEGEYVIRRLHKKNGVIKLLSANPAYADFLVKDELIIFGVVTSTILTLI